MHDDEMTRLLEKSPTSMSSERDDDEVLGGGSLTVEEVRQSVEDYPDYAPQKLEDLDPFRYDDLPETLRKRREDKKSAVSLTKDEAVKLVEWKLKHGKFRPNLMKLVTNNSEAAVKEATESAFAHAEPLKALDILTKLSGIGPATASLLLSVNSPESIPFFSDELFRFVHLEKNGKGEMIGWDRKIAYNKKEYTQVYETCTRLRDGLNAKAASDEQISMLDLEKHAYVLSAKRNSVPKAGNDKGTKRSMEEANDDNNIPKVETTEKKRRTRSTK